MDPWTVGFLGAALLFAFVALVIVLRMVERMAENRLEVARMKQAWYAKMQGHKAEKRSRKDRDDEDDDQDDGDDLDDLIEAVRPYEGFIRGVVASRHLPVNVDKLMAHDEREKAKVGAFLEQQMAKAQQQGPRAPGGGYL